MEQLRERLGKFGSTLLVVAIVLVGVIWGGGHLSFLPTWAEATIYGVGVVVGVLLLLLVLIPSWAR